MTTMIKATGRPAAFRRVAGTSRCIAAECFRTRVVCADGSRIARAIGRYFRVPRDGDAVELNDKAVLRIWAEENGKAGP